MEWEIQLGNRVKCRITGYIGIATARVEYINGEVEYQVMPEHTNSGEYPKGAYLSATRLVYVDEGVKVEKIAPVMGFAGGRKEL